MTEVGGFGPTEIAELVARGYEAKFCRPVSMVKVGINADAIVTHFDGSLEVTAPDR